jgi:hypothetical protein
LGVADRTLERLPLAAPVGVIIYADDQREIVRCVGHVHSTLGDGRKAVALFFFARAVYIHSTTGAYMKHCMMDAQDMFNIELHWAGFIPGECADPEVYAAWKKDMTLLAAYATVSHPVKGGRVCLTDPSTTVR